MSKSQSEKGATGRLLAEDLPVIDGAEVEEAEHIGAEAAARESESEVVAVARVEGDDGGSGDSTVATQPDTRKPSPHKPAWATAEAEAGETEARRPPKGLGRDTGAAVAAATSAPATHKPPKLSPWQRLRRRALLIGTGRLIGGLLTLGILFLLLTSGSAWATLLFGWVLLSILADEFDGWFGYIGALMGVLTLFGPFATGDPEWQTLLPLVGCALLALLIVKHSGGPLVLPFAAAVFALPIYAAANFGELLDGSLILVANPELYHSAVVAAVVGLSISFVRQLIDWAVAWSAARTERRELQA